VTVRKRDQIASWVASASGHTPTPDEARCLEALCVIDTGPHNLHPIDGWRGKGVHWGRNWVSITMHQRDISTTDFDAMTRLVLAGHRLAVRVSVSPVLMGYDLIDGRPGDESDDYEPTFHDPGDEQIGHDHWGAGLCLTAWAREPSRTGLSGMIGHPTTANLVDRITGVRR
jgi:hypothetical protein